MTNRKGLARRGLAAAAVAVGTVTATSSALAQECFIGEIKMFAGNFAPRDHMLAHGQLLQIAQYQALFSILGTTYGGDGRSTFALPDMRGRVAIGAGQGQGLNNMPLGLMTGYEWTEPRPGQAAAGAGAAVATPAQITNMQPSTAVNYIVCVNGYFPTR